MEREREEALAALKAHCAEWGDMATWAAEKVRGAALLLCMHAGD